MAKYIATQMHSKLFLGNNVDRLVFSQDIKFTKNRAYRAAAISFFLHPALLLKYPDMKDAVHAGRMTIFKHPMNFKELCLPPCVSEGAYTEEEQAWCTATISYLVDNLDANGPQSRGIPESTVSRRTRPWTPRHAAAAPAASSSSPTAAACPRSGPGPIGAGGQRTRRGRRRGRRGRRWSSCTRECEDHDGGSLPGPRAHRIGQ